MSTSAPAKKPGVYYAADEKGVELPIVDVTHPEFALSVGPAEQKALVEKFFRQQRPFRFLPAWLRKRLMARALRDSVLARALGTAEGTYLSGLNTYLLKLGANNLEAVTTNPVDRRIAESAPVLSIRLRMQDVATLLAEYLAPALLAHPGRALHLLNIAGGPTMDSLNALILLRRDHPQSLVGRRVVISVLDLDTAGPAFGARALAALSAPGAPLHGVQAELRRLPYDWSRPRALAPVLDTVREENALMAVSSEGGLFDYGSDEEIVGNLQMLYEALVVVGSVTRADEPMRSTRKFSTVRLQLRGLDAFGVLAARAGWTIDRAIERPVSDQVALKPACGVR
jgi:hypothetical protein